jgi:hypothetical protein
MSKNKDASEIGERMEGELDDPKERQTITRDYYSSRPKTFDTMLGGYTQVHDVDIQESNQLLQTLFKVCYLKTNEDLFIYFSNIMEN